VSPVHDADHDVYDEVPTRSIFAATWFRVVLIVIVLGVIGAIAVPYVLDWMNPPVVRAPVAAKPPTPTPAPTAPGSSETAPAEKKDSMLIPAPVAPAVSAPAPARPAETKTATATQPKSTPPSESKSTPPPSTKSTPPGPTKGATAKTEAGSAAPPGESKSALAASETSKPVVGKPESPAKSDTVAKAPSAGSGSSAAKDDAASAPATKPTAAKGSAATAGAATAAATGSFWVQVGAFKDAETARRVATKLREENFNVAESLTRAGGSTPAAKGTTSTAKTAAGDTGNDRYDVYVSGPSTDEVTKRLAAKGLVAEPAGGAIVVKPSLPLRDAVALSKDLAADGFKVQVKRAGGTSPAAATAGASVQAANGGAELHRVRVGAFPDRAAAQAAARDLEAKGYKPFIARGDR